MLDKIDLLGRLPDKNYWIKKLAAGIHEPGADFVAEEKALTDVLKKASLKDRVRETSQSRIEKDSLAAMDGKIETLIRGLVGLMLVYGTVWKEVLERESLAFLPKDSLLNLMIRRGPEFHFSFDELVKNLDSQADVEKAGNIYSENKYQIGLNNEPEEIILENPVGEAIRKIKNIRYEINKGRLEKISKDLDSAKKNKDGRAVKFLSDEWRRINQEQAILNNELNR